LSAKNWEVLGGILLKGPYVTVAPDFETETSFVKLSVFKGVVYEITRGVSDLSKNRVVPAALR
jgi:L-2-hydroxyglutarate oxidase LhgO